MVKFFTSPAATLLLFAAYGVIYSAAQIQCEELAICFSIDESGSITYSNFRKTISLAKTLIAEMEMEASKSGIQHSYAAWTFADTSSSTRGDGDNLAALTTDAAYVQSRLDNAVYNGGNTNIYAGMLRCSAELLKTNKKRILFLISDGKQNIHADGDLTALQNMAEVLKHDQKVTILTLGTFTSSVSLYDRKDLITYLQKLSSGTSYVFSSQFDVMASLVPSIRRIACNAQPAAPAAVSKVQGCKPTTVCFALDDSYTTGAVGFQAQLDAVEKTILTLATSATTSKYAIVKYAYWASSQVDLIADYNSALLDLKLLGFSASSYYRHFSRALDACYDKIKDESLHKVIVLFASSWHYGVGDATDYAERLRNQRGVDIIVVGDEKFNSNFRPFVGSNDYLLGSPSLPFAESLMDQLATTTCGVKYQPPPATATPSPYDKIYPRGNDSCSNISVCFAIDESGSIGSSDFNRELNFVKDIIETVVVDSNPSYPPYFAAWLFDADSKGTDDLGSLSSDYKGMLHALDQAASLYNGGQTNIFEGVLRCKAELAKSPDRIPVMVVLTDGKQNIDVNGTKAQLVSMADDMKKDGMHVFTVAMFKSGTTGSVRADLSAYLQELSSGKGYAFESDFGTLGDRVAAISDSICASQPDTPILPPRSTCPCSPMPPSGICADYERTDATGTHLCRFRTCNAGFSCDALSGTYTCFVVQDRIWKFIREFPSNKMEEKPCDQQNVTRIIREVIP